MRGSELAVVPAVKLASPLVASQLTTGVAPAREASPEKIRDVRGNRSMLPAPAKMGGCSWFGRS